MVINEIIAINKASLREREGGYEYIRIGKSGAEVDGTISREAI